MHGPARFFNLPTRKSLSILPSHSRSQKNNWHRVAPSDASLKSRFFFGYTGRESIILNKDKKRNQKGKKGRPRVGYTIQATKKKNKQRKKIGAKKRLHIHKALSGVSKVKD